MNKKFLLIILICLTLALTLGSVSAAEFTNHQFGNDFSMKIEKGTHFEKNSTKLDLFEMESKMTVYMNEKLVIAYTDSPIFAGNSSSLFYQYMFEQTNPDLSQCYETQDDDLTILQPVKQDKTHVNLVGVSSGNKTVMIIGQDINDLKTMGKSVKFD